MAPFGAKVSDQLKRKLSEHTAIIFVNELNRPG